MKADQHYAREDVRAWVEAFSTAFTSLPFVMHSDCEMLVSCKIRHNHVTSSQSSFDELFHMIVYDDFTLLVNCINTTVLAEQPLHHNIILEKQDHCSVSRVNTKTAISRSRIKCIYRQNRKKIYTTLFLLVRFSDHVKQCLPISA